MSKVKKKLRVLIRDDGAEFAYTPVLEVNARMVPGWKIIYEGDEPDEIIPDKATARELNPNSVSQRELKQQEEIARLREQLAQIQGFENNPVSAQMVEDTPMQPGETPLPEAPPIDELVNLTDAAETPIAEEPIEFTPEPKLMTPSAIMQASKAKLAAQIKDMTGEVIDPDSVDRDFLREACNDAQEAYTERMSAGE